MGWIIRATVLLSVLFAGCEPKEPPKPEAHCVAEKFPKYRYANDRGMAYRYWVTSDDGYWVEVSPMVHLHVERGQMLESYDWKKR